MKARFLRACRAFRNWRLKVQNDFGEVLYCQAPDPMERFAMGSLCRNECLGLLLSGHERLPDDHPLARLAEDLFHLQTYVSRMNSGRHFDTFPGWLLYAVLHGAMAGRDVS